MRDCSACGAHKTKREYSKTQWRKDNSRCKTCVERGFHHTPDDDEDSDGDGDSEDDFIYDDEDSDDDETPSPPDTPALGEGALALAAGAGDLPQCQSILRRQLSFALVAAVTSLVERGGGVKRYREQTPFHG